MQLFEQRNTPRFHTQTDELLNNVAVGCLYIYFFIEEVFVFVVYFGGGDRRREEDTSSCC